MWTIKRLLDPAENPDAKYLQGHHKQLVADFTARSGFLDEMRAARDATERADQVMQWICDQKNGGVIETYDEGRVRLVYLGAHVDRPFAVHHTQFGKPERFHAIEAARAFFRRKAVPPVSLRIPVCEGCQVVYRRDVPGREGTWACPCCGERSRKIILCDLSPEKQIQMNRNTETFFRLRMRARRFKTAPSGES